jgi:predicted metal-dependent peptidase
MNSDEEYASQDLHEEQIVEVDDANANNLSLQKESIESNETDNIEYDKSENKEESNTTSDTDSLNEELKEHFEQIFQKLKRQGNLPKDLKLLIPEYFSHKVDWREVLYSYIASYAKSTYSFIPPNMKYLYRGIYLPSLSSDLLRIVIAIDTSGSVDESLLAEFLAEVNSIMQVYPNYEIDLITADAKVQSHEVFLPAESLNYEISGGGGTDFRPVFEYIDSYIDYPTLLLYFTDGMGTYPSTDTNYDVLWIMPQEKDVPFGEVVVLDT